MSHPTINRQSPFVVFLLEVITMGLYNPYFITKHCEAFNALGKEHQISSTSINAYWAGAALSVVTRVVGNSLPASQSLLALMGIASLVSLPLLFYGWFTSVARGAQILTEEYQRRGIDRKVYRGNSILGVCYLQFHLNNLFYNPETPGAPKSIQEAA